MRAYRTNTAGLTLVEIALAIGIVAVTLSSIVALIGTASQSAGEADLDTMAALIAGQVVAEMRSVPFDALWFADIRVAETGDSPPGAPADSIYYFDSQGTRLPGIAAQSDAAYACKVKKTPDGDMKDFAGDRAHLMHIHLLIHGPAIAEPSARNSRSFHTRIARY